MSNLPQIFPPLGLLLHVGDVSGSIYASGFRLSWQKKLRGVKGRGAQVLYVYIESVKMDLGAVIEYLSASPLSRFYLNLKCAPKKAAKAASFELKHTFLPLRRAERTAASRGGVKERTPH